MLLVSCKPIKMLNLAPASNPSLNQWKDGENSKEVKVSEVKMFKQNGKYEADKNINSGQI